MLDGYISMKEAESLSRRCYRTLTKWIKEEKISGFKYGGQWLIQEKSLRSYVEKCMNNF